MRNGECGIRNGRFRGFVFGKTQPRRLQKADVANPKTEIKKIVEKGLLAVRAAVRGFVLMPDSPSVSSELRKIFAQRGRQLIASGQIPKSLRRVSCETVPSARDAHFW